MRKWHPKFISKKELGKGIPSVSYNLKYGGSALIDRKDPKQALPEIKKVKYEKTLESCKIHAEFEVYLKTGETFLQDAWIVTK